MTAQDEPVFFSLSRVAIMALLFAAIGIVAGLVGIIVGTNAPSAPNRVEVPYAGLACGLEIAFGLCMVASAICVAADKKLASAQERWRRDHDVGSSTEFKPYRE